MFCPNPECPDFEATGVPGEYRDELSTCPVCGATLVPDDPTRDVGGAPEGGPVGSAALEPVVETETSAETDIVRSILDGAGIPYAVQGQDERAAYRAGHAAFRFHPLGGAVRFLVPADRLEEARALLTEAEPEAGEG